MRNKVRHTTKREDPHRLGALRDLNRTQALERGTFGPHRCAPGTCHASRAPRAGRAYRESWQHAWTTLRHRRSAMLAPPGCHIDPRCQIAPLGAASGSANSASLVGRTMAAACQGARIYHFQRPSSAAARAASTGGASPDATPTRCRGGRRTAIVRARLAQFWQVDR